jgi:hypothetical protein
LVLNGYLKLNDAEKKEFIKEISEYQKKSINEQRTFSENFQKSTDSFVLGPVSRGYCSTCGRG